MVEVKIVTYTVDNGIPLAYGVNCELKTCRRMIISTGCLNEMCHPELSIGRM